MSRSGCSKIAYHWKYYSKLIKKYTVLGENPCGTDNKGCSHLCLLANRNGKERTTSCACPRNMTLKDDGKTCQGIQTTRPPPTITDISPDLFTTTTTDNPTTTNTATITTSPIQSTKSKLRTTKRPTTPKTSHTTTTSSMSTVREILKIHVFFL